MLRLWEKEITKEMFYAAKRLIKIWDVNVDDIINQYNMHKQYLEKKNWRCWYKNTRYKLVSDYNYFENKN